MFESKYSGFAAFAAVLGLASAACAVPAGTRRPMTQEQMVERADFVGVVEVKGSQTRWLEHALWTLVDVQVADRLKGERARKQVTLVVPGGRDPQTGAIYAYRGVPTSFSPGAQLFVFGRESRRVRGALEPLEPDQGLIAAQAGAAGAEQLAALRARIRAIVEIDRMYELERQAQLDEFLRRAREQGELERARRGIRQR